MANAGGEPGPHAHHVECSICMEFVDWDKDKLVSLVSCGHVFHDQCIQAWFDSGQSDPGYSNSKPCPHCRKVARRGDIRTIYLQTIKDEQSEEIKKELENVREQLRKAKLRDNAAALDPMVEQMVSLTAKMRVSEAATAQRVVHLPNSRHFLFEGCQGTEDKVIFNEYTGPKNWHHSRKICYSPVLEVGSSLARDTIHNSLMNTIFQQQMEVLRKTYDEKKDGRLELTVKFGRLYIFEPPAEMTMLVRDFNYGIGIQHKKADPQAIRTSFSPTETPTERIVEAMRQARFEEREKEEVVVVNVDHSKSRPRIIFEVYLDKDLKFRSLRQGDRSFVNIDIRRKDESKPDIRLAVKSVDEKFKADELERPAKLYAHDNIVRWDRSQPNRLIVDKSAIGKVSYARRKIMTSYHLQGRDYGGAIEQQLEVKLINTTSFEDPQYNGTFKRMKHQSEVYIRINGKDSLYRMCEDEAFLQKLLMFCDKFQ